MIQSPSGGGTWVPCAVSCLASEPIGVTKEQASGGPMWLLAGSEGGGVFKYEMARVGGTYGGGYGGEQRPKMVYDSPHIGRVNFVKCSPHQVLKHTHTHTCRHTHMDTHTHMHTQKSTHMLTSHSHTHISHMHHHTNQVDDSLQVPLILI